MSLIFTVSHNITTLRRVMTCHAMSSVSINVSIFRFDKGLTLETLALEHSLQWPMYIINPFDKAKSSCYTPQPTWHHSFFRNLPPIFNVSHDMSCHTVSRQVLSHHVMSHCVIASDVTSYHAIPALASLTAHSPDGTFCMSPCGPICMVMATGFPVDVITSTAHAASSTLAKNWKGRALS